MYTLGQVGRYLPMGKDISVNTTLSISSFIYIFKDYMQWTL